MNSTLFTDAMALTPAGDGVYEGELNEHWTIGPKVHGGAMLALCANAAVNEHSTGESAAGQPNPSPFRATFCGRRTRGRCGW